MSRIYFHTEHFEDVEVSGRERAWMGCLLSDLMAATLGNLRYVESWFKPLLPAGHYLQSMTEERFAAALSTWLHVGHDPLKLPSGTVDPWILSLNTGLALGGDALKLFARIHGQCEVHCWVEGAKDKAFVADTIETGLVSGIMRDNEGWDGVLKLMRKEGDFPVVCSYSVCEQFPNANTLPSGATEEGRDRFDELPEAERWALAFRGLKDSGGGLRITKKGWGEFRFTPDVNAFNLRSLATKKSQPEAT